MTPWIAISPSALLGAALLYLIFNPEKAERVAAWIYKLFANVSRLAERGHVASDIQADVNTFCATLNRQAPGAVPYKMKISWVEGETREAFLKNGEIIVRLRHHPDQDRNLVAATMVFLGKTLLTRTRAYLDDRLCRSIDLMATRGVLIASKRPSALEHFHAEVLEPDIRETPPLQEDCQLLQQLDDVGFFTRVLLRELTALGNRLFPALPEPASGQEARKLLGFLQTIAAKRRGEDVPLDFIERRIKLGFVLVARAERTIRFDPGPYVEAIRGHFRSGAQTVYLCGEGTNVDYVKAVSKRILAIKQNVKEEHKYSATSPDGTTYEAICVIFKGTSRAA